MKDITKIIRISEKENSNWRKWRFSKIIHAILEGTQEQLEKVWNIYFKNED